MSYIIHVKTNSLNIALDIVETLSRGFTKEEIRLNTTTSE